ncbi:MAG: GNAT family N-acetyltransferase, partial [bacterium]
MTGDFNLKGPIPGEGEAPGDGGPGTPEPSFRIRSARPVDLPAILGLVTAAALCPDGIAGFFEAGYVAAERMGRIVGCAGLETYGLHGLLRSVAVSPECRGLGIGSALVDDRLEWGRSRGLTS